MGNEVVVRGAARPAEETRTPRWPRRNDGGGSIKMQICILPISTVTKLLKFRRNECPLPLRCAAPR
jgi:hypothetical protein